MGKQWKQCQTFFGGGRGAGGAGGGGAPKSLQMMIAAMKLKTSYFLEGTL